MKELKMPWWLRRKEEGTPNPVKADYTVISSVNEHLLHQLRKQLVPQVIASRDEIGLCSPGEHGDIMLGLYLYDIRENEEVRVTGMQPYSEELQQFPPLYLNLYYMLTAYSNIDIRYREEENHRIMAKVLQIFYDYQGSRNHELHIEYQSMMLEQKMAVWNNFGMGYQLSLFYKVAPVKLNSTITKEIVRVKEIQLETPYGTGGRG